VGLLAGLWLLVSPLHEPSFEIQGSACPRLLRSSGIGKGLKWEGPEGQEAWGSICTLDMRGEYPQAEMGLMVLNSCP